MIDAIDLNRDQNAKKIKEYFESLKSEYGYYTTINSVTS